MAKKIEEQMTEDIKSTVDCLLDEALKSANRDDNELLVFYLEEARRIASEIDYNINSKIKEIKDLTESWCGSKIEIK